MSRRPSRLRPVQAASQVTPEELRHGVVRLNKVLEKVKAFEPTGVTDQNNIPHVEALAAAVDEALVRTFGADTLDYKRYSDAVFFDNGPFNYAFPVPIGKVHESLARSRLRSLALLEQAIASIEGRLSEVPAAADPLSADHNRLRFSRRTLVAAIGVLERLTQAKFTRLLYKLGPEFPGLVGEDSFALSKRLSNLIGVYDLQPGRTVDGGETLQDVIVQEAAALVRSDSLSWGDDAPEWVSDQREFCRLLAMDGFVITDGTLRRSLPDDVDLPSAQNELDRLLAKNAFIVPAGHLKQAIEAHAVGNWASANSQIRTFLDALFDEISVRFDPNAASLGSGQPRRTQLAARSFFSRALNEWDDDGRNFINGLFKRLSPQGSHPGLSDEADCTFRLHIALLTARLFLSRYDEQATP